MNNFLSKFVRFVLTLTAFKGSIQTWTFPSKLLAGCTISLILLVSGCNQAETWWAWSQATQFITINNVSPTQTPGRYHISGEANLADGMSIAVSAVRPLVIGKPPVDPEDIHQTRYAILDRQLVPVTAGNWQVELTLRSAQSSNYETWQTAYGDIQEPVTPAPMVNFLATLDPGLQPDGLAQRLLRDTAGFQQGSIRVDDDGELFAIATKTLDIAPPPGSIVGTRTPATSVPLEQAQPANSTPSLATNREPASNLPLTPDAYFQ